MPHTRYERLPHASLDRSPSPRRSSTDLEVEEGTGRPFHSLLLDDPLHGHNDRSRSLFGLLGFGNRKSKYGRRRRLVVPPHWRQLSSRVSLISGIILLVLIVLTPIFNPSYSRKPAHYTGTNPHHEKVFIAANIVDEELIRGAWGRAVQGLVKLLGEDNVFLSVYENDSGEGTKAALKELDEKIKCSKAIVSDHIDLPTFSPTVTFSSAPSGNNRIKRIEYLSRARNEALRPLDADSRLMRSGVQYNKLLFLNDVVFDPRDAADLLFATNVGKDGRAKYRAACSMDFINAFKFYDTFASRDTNGFELGVPFFPMYAKSGDEASRNDILAGNDAVRVKSCWGGMTAFEAKWFQASSAKEVAAQYGNSTQVQLPIRFRAERELFWEASECCLVHADINVAANPNGSPDVAEETEGEFPPGETGVYVNPFIRVAYTESSFRWLGFVRRFERLFRFGHWLINTLVGLPRRNERREHRAGEEVVEKVWKFDNSVERGRRGYEDEGRYEDVKRIVSPGQFCGLRMMQVLKEKRKPGERMWEILKAPPL